MALAPRPTARALTAREGRTPRHAPAGRGSRARLGTARHAAAPPGPAGARASRCARAPRRLARRPRRARAGRALSVSPSAEFSSGPRGPPRVPARSPATAPPRARGARSPAARSPRGVPQADALQGGRSLGRWRLGSCPARAAEYRPRRPCGGAAALPRLKALRDSAETEHRTRLKLGRTPRPNPIKLPRCSRISIGAQRSRVGRRFLPLSLDPLHSLHFYPAVRLTPRRLPLRLRTLGQRPSRWLGCGLAGAPFNPGRWVRAPTSTQPRDLLLGRRWSSAVKFAGGGTHTP